MLNISYLSLVLSLFLVSLSPPRFLTLCNCFVGTQSWFLLSLVSAGEQLITVELNLLKQAKTW